MEQENEGDWDESSQDIEEEEGDKPEKKRKKGRGAGQNGGNEDAKNRRLEKNRLSAKESRKRKKNYMSNLEERNNALEKDKARLIRRINALEEREKLNYLSHVDTVDQLL